MERRRTMFRSGGAELKDLYVVFGKYDMVGIVDAPSDEAIATVVLKNGTYGMARIGTLKAFSEAEGNEIIRGIQ